jgi:hypothetical protein
MTQVIPIDCLRQAELPSKADAPLSRGAARDPRPLNHDEGLVTVAEQTWEASSEGPRSRPPVQPEIGPLPIPDLVPSPQFEITFDLLDGVPKLRALHRYILIEQVPTP